MPHIQVMSLFSNICLLLGGGGGGGGNGGGGRGNGGGGGQTIIIDSGKFAHFLRPFFNTECLSISMPQ